MGLKLVSFYPANAETAVPTHHAVIVLMRPDTGEPHGGDGRHDHHRDAHGRGLGRGTRRLAPADSRVLALIGCGVQAGAHLEALRRVRAFEEVRVWSRTPERAERFAAAHGVVASPTSARRRGRRRDRDRDECGRAGAPRRWVKPGAHVNAVGACRPNWRELDDDLMLSCALIVDSREAALAESGDVILSGAAIYAEAGESSRGEGRARRRAATTVFMSLGLAVEDIAAAQLVCRADRRPGLSVSSSRGARGYSADSISATTSRRAGSPPSRAIRRGPSRS